MYHSHIPGYTHTRIHGQRRKERTGGPEAATFSRRGRPEDARPRARPGMVTPAAPTAPAAMVSRSGSGSGLPDGCLYG